MIRLPAALREELRARAHAAYPAECCGALLGGDEGGDRVVARLIPVENRDPQAAARYQIPANAVRRLEREAEAAGLEVVGFYHSHPDHPAAPSTRDRDGAWPWYSYLIVPVTSEGAGSPRSWRLPEDRGEMVEEGVRVG